MSTIQISIDERVSEHLGDSPEQVERAALEIIVLDLYRQHDISAGRGAEILHLDEFAFIRWSGPLGIAHFDTNAEDWANQHRAIEKK